MATCCIRLSSSVTKLAERCSGVGLVWSDDKPSRAVVLQVRWYSQTASGNESLRPLEPLSEEEAFIQKYLKLADTALKSKPTRNAA